jgi:hypothetical protein
MTAETTHECPADGGQRTPCCGQTPFELPRTDRITEDSGLVTCGKPERLLTPEIAAAFIRECVTIVKPGETLAMRAPTGWAPEQVEQCQQYFDAMTEWRDLSIKLLFLPGEEFAVITQAAVQHPDGEGTAPQASPPSRASAGHRQPVSP